MENSPFSKLPAELRVQIFELVLYSPSDTGVLKYDNEGVKFDDWMIANHRRALTTVCRQFRAESYLIFYRLSKICFFPLELDKFEPGFFAARNREKELMMWEYLGNPLDSFAGLLFHLGDECKGNIETVDVCIGTWNANWASDRDALVVWLTRDLAGVLTLFEGSDARINLCFDMDLPRTYFNDRNTLPVSLPISDIAEAHHVLEDVIQRENQVATSWFPYISKKRRQILGQCYVSLKKYLDLLQRQIEDSRSR